MDGVRLKSAGKFVDKNRERENICKLYEGPACFKDFLSNLECIFIFIELL